MEMMRELQLASSQCAEPLVDPSSVCAAHVLYRDDGVHRSAADGSTSPHDVIM